MAGTHGLAVWSEEYQRYIIQFRGKTYKVHQLGVRGVSWIATVSRGGRDA